VNENPAPPVRFLAHPLDTMLAALARLSTTRANGLAGLACDVSVSALLLAIGLWRGDVRIGTALAVVTAGLLLFSFIEYCFHRWLFHGRAGMLEQGHTKHHEQPLGYDALPFFLPPLGMLALAAAFALALPAGVACLFVGALAAGYASYGIGHTVIHSMRFTTALAKRWAAAHHIHHHHPDHNFGVTTPLWDFVLGTRYVPARTRLRSPR
jgi:sterol desaturase/sphingolipid hydroxylase (fatty acid hydroxylase superfamily)